MNYTSFQEKITSNIAIKIEKALIKNLLKFTHKINLSVLISYIMICYLNYFYRQIFYYLYLCALKTRV